MPRAFSFLVLYCIVYIYYTDLINLIMSLIHKQKSDFPYPKNSQFILFALFNFMYAHQLVANGTFKLI